MTEKNGKELLLNFRQEEERCQEEGSGKVMLEEENEIQDLEVNIWIQTYENKRLGRGNSKAKEKQTSAMHLKEIITVELP